MFVTKAHHIEEKHTQLVFPCPHTKGKCKQFGTQRALDLHVQTVHFGHKEQCPYPVEGYPNVRCSETYTQRHNLINHIHKHHLDIRIICSSRKPDGSPCGKEFRSSAYLKTHTIAFHREHIHLCHHTGCGKRFATEQALKAHRLSGCQHTLGQGGVAPDMFLRLYRRFRLDEKIDWIASEGGVSYSTASWIRKQYRFPKKKLPEFEVSQNFSNAKDELEKFLELLSDDAESESSSLVSHAIHPPSLSTLVPSTATSSALAPSVALPSTLAVPSSSRTIPVDQETQDLKQRDDALVLRRRRLNQKLGETMELQRRLEQGELDLERKRYGLDRREERLKKWEDTLKTREQKVKHSEEEMAKWKARFRDWTDKRVDRRMEEEALSARHRQREADWDLWRQETEQWKEEHEQIMR